MKPPIETTDPKYLRRLVRELNSEGMVNGFYASIATFRVRCRRARLRNGELQVRSLHCEPEWFTPSNHSFDDCSGRAIVASRRQ